MSSYKWQHHDPSLSSSAHVSEMTPATHSMSTAREKHLFPTVFSEQDALRAVMALGERYVVPNCQQSPFSCTNSLFSAPFQEPEIRNRTHLMVSTGKWQPFPQEMFLYRTHPLPPICHSKAVRKHCWPVMPAAVSRCLAKNRLRKKC